MTKEIEEKVREQARQWFISSDMNVKDFALSVAKYVYEITTATPSADVQERAKGSWKPAVKPENAQCTEVCTIDEDYPIEIMAEGVHCLGCGRKRPPTKYYLAVASSLQAENERLREALEKILAMKEPGNNYAFNRCWHIAHEALNKQ